MCALDIALPRPRWSTTCATTGLELLERTARNQLLRPVLTRVTLRRIQASLPPLPAGRSGRFARSQCESDYRGGALCEAVRRAIRRNVTYRHCAWTMPMRIWLGDERLVRYLAVCSSTRASVGSVHPALPRDTDRRAVALFRHQDGCRNRGTIDLRFDGEGLASGGQRRLRFPTQLARAYLPPRSRSRAACSRNTAPPKR